MRWSRAFIPTLKERPQDAQIPSHILLVRGGFIRQIAAGIYDILPLGWRVVRKIETIVRQEMDHAGAQEVLMPAAVPAELWRESGRWDQYGPELLRFKDRKGADFCVGPTHEEVVVDMVRKAVKSYRDLPINLYQIQSKFRDELRPRAGLMRGREFLMKDAYSFDVSDEAAQESYDHMYEAYNRIFVRCGLEFRAVEADTGAIGGSRSHEFQVLATTGEDAIVSCNRCEYAANTEMAEIAGAPDGAAGQDEAGNGTDTGEPESQTSPALSVVDTPKTRTIDEVCAFLERPAEQLIKTLIYIADDRPVVILVRGDHAVNEVAVKRLLGARQLFLARAKQVEQATGAPQGFAGPIGLPGHGSPDGNGDGDGDRVAIWADHALDGGRDLVCGANRADAHHVGVDMARDVPGARYASLRLVNEGDPCPRCADGRFEGFRGIEVGHVFFLGTKYSEPMGCTFLDESGAINPMVMGCYGIGITRIAAAAVEQNHDDGGIVWPMAIAPYEVLIIPLQMKDDAVIAAADRLYDKLRQRGLEVLLDDRRERPGSKFKDADLIGVPLRIAIGKRSLQNGQVEVSWRRDGKDGEAEKIALTEVAELVTERVRGERTELAGIPRTPHLVPV